MPDQGTPAPPVALAALTPETLAAIAAFASAFAQQQNQPVPAPAAPVVPPFTGSGGTSEFGSKSLPALFPSVESQIILDIVSHACTPLDLPRLLSPLAARQDYVAPLSSAPSAEHTLALKHFPSFHSLLRPLLKYFEVLGAFAASSGKPWEVFVIMRSLSDYISHLTELHQQYKWSAVVIYHVEFHTIRLWDMKAGDYSAWGRPDLNLLSRIVFMHPLPSPRPTPILPTRHPTPKAPLRSLRRRRCRWTSRSATTTTAGFARCCPAQRSVGTYAARAMENTWSLPARRPRSSAERAVELAPMLLGSLTRASSPRFIPPSL
ncbi:hypothetical protein B0H10DRAFT_2201311 [Mycena sp. CBHHK59/15]|nr:hypothetical protein B0H10DRAFT_2201311 [Mycena sp. CBHHK59/15]